MYLQLQHKNMHLYKELKNLVKAVYLVSNKFPDVERYALSSQLRRSATSVILNFSEGSSKSSQAERARFYEIARSSLVELDTIIEIANDLGYFNPQEFELEQPITLTFKRLSALIKTTKSQLR
ncbi:MAG TPA: four helix bundle protein [Chitinophagales bacterium]|nr:four helix bundle protein [Chitinophagales bacterium]